MPSLTTGPAAHEITVPQILQLLDGDFSSFAEAASNGEFSFWIGSGISRNAPNLGDLLESCVEYLRRKFEAECGHGVYSDALSEVMEISGYQNEPWTDWISAPFCDWPKKNEIISNLWNKYSDVLDVRIQGQPEDFILWDAINIREAFRNPKPPAAEHLSIAALILEGAVTELASANWDTFVENAVERLSGHANNVLQVIVEPTQLRSSPGRARLLKFHGCIKHATDEPAVFRKYLTGSTRQITDWPNEPAFSAVRNDFVSIATNKKSLILGLSLQDEDLQQIISKAQKIHPWPWPCEPDAPGYIFCQDELPRGQKNALKVAYRDAYDEYGHEIVVRSHLRAWPEQVLIALLIRIVFEKLRLVLEEWLNEHVEPALKEEFSDSMKKCRDFVGELVGNDRNKFAEEAISVWPRVLSVFKHGRLPKQPDRYDTISSFPPSQVLDDDAPRAAHLGKLGFALAILQRGQDEAKWRLAPPLVPTVEGGAFAVQGRWDGAQVRPIFLVRSYAEALELQKEGAFDANGAIVLHGDDIWQQLRSTGGNARSPRSSFGRTGRVRTSHVSLTSLLTTCASADELRDEFMAEAAI